MGDEMRNGLGGIPCEVVDPESGLSISKLEFVDGIKYNTIAEKLLVFMNLTTSVKVYSLVYNFFGYG
ncbi:hypothetical protein BMS3Abin04_01847 [bacterium BMS3Abin04]|nr:hypothetical protein BMS3Abin04_01847 [bacterium BMS3Abin04]